MGALNITSKTVTVNKSAEELYTLMNSFENFSKVMPESVEKFESDDNSFLFQMKGLPEVRLVADERVAHSLIKFKSASSKLDFTLSCHIADEGATSKVHYTFEGEFNMMMRMMIEKPLTNFIEHLADKTAVLA